MPEILHDSILLQFITIIIAVAAIVISVLIYWKQRQHKALSYEIISCTSLLSEEVKRNLQILFDGKPVQDVHLVVVRITNSGNVPIVPADYERSVNLSFSENTKILTTGVSETNPESLRATATVKIENGKVVLAPVLLNGGDSITLKMLLTQFDGLINVDGRIVGVKDIQESVKRRFQYLFFLNRVTILTITAGIILIISITLIIHIIIEPLIRQLYEKLIFDPTLTLSLSLVGVSVLILILIILIYIFQYLRFRWRGEL